MIHSEFTVRSAPIEIELASPLAASDPLNRILDAARRNACLRFGLGELDPSQELVTGFLRSVAEVRRQHLYGLTFSCRLPIRVTASQARLLRDAGVSSATFRLDACDKAPRSASWENAERMCSVKLLHSAGISVDWQLFVPLQASGQEIQSLRSLLPFMRHLPPATLEAPDASTSISAERRQLQVDIDDWRLNYVSRTLTYARGPGFIRIFDRRQGEREWSFVVLNKQQAAMFAFCERMVPFETIVKEFSSGNDEVGIRHFFENLVARQLVLEVEGWYYSLAVRKRLDERWSSGDY